MFRKILSFFYFLYVSIRTITDSWSLRFAKWIMQYRPFVLSPDAFKVLVIGDDFAEGFGDYIPLFTNSGVCQYLASLTGAEYGSRVRREWGFINEGVTGSTSGEWVPGSKYYQRIIEKNYPKVEVVIIMLGVMDVASDCVGIPDSAYNKESTNISESDLPQTICNIQNIANSFREKGKKVIVCDIPIIGAKLKQYEKQINLLNQMLQTFVQSTSKEENPIQLVKVSHPFFQKPELIGFDDFHFNDKGYLLISKDIFKFLLPLMVKVEWNFFKNVLTRPKHPY